MLALFFSHSNYLRPILLSKVVHSHTGHFVDADKHCLAACPNVSVMIHKIFRHLVKAVFCRKQVYLFGKFLFEFCLLGRVKIGLFYGFGYTLVQFGIVLIHHRYVQPFTPVLIEQRHGCAIVHSPFEVINGDIAAECPLCNVVVSQQRCTRKTYARTSRQQAAHVLCVIPVLAAMGFVRHDKNVIIGIERPCIGLVEFLYQSEYEAGIVFKHGYQSFAACGYVLLGLSRTKQSTTFKRAADLFVQFIAVGQHNDGRRACEAATYLLRKKQHGITLSAALCMPKYPQLAVAEFSLGVSLDRFVHAEILVISGEDFCSLTIGMVVKNEIFQ